MERKVMLLIAVVFMLSVGLATLDFDRLAQRKDLYETPVSRHTNLTPPDHNTKAAPPVKAIATEPTVSEVTPAAADSTNAVHPGGPHEDIKPEIFANSDYAYYSTRTLRDMAESGNVVAMQVLAMRFFTDRTFRT